MRVTLREIADQLGVSTATVSRALKGDPAIAVATRARVAAAAAELGYRANAAARTLVTGRSRVIGLHVSRLSGWYVAMALRLQALGEADGYATILTSGGNAPPAHVDGDIGIGTLPAHVLRGEARPGARRAVVSIDVHPEVDYVAVDLYAPAQAAMRHLLGDGRRRIAIVLPGAAPDWAPKDPRRLGPRERAYVEAMRGAGLPLETVSAADATRPATRDAVLAHVRDHGLPDAFSCHNDDMAIGAYRALVELKARVPEQVALIGCDGIEDGAFLERALSTIVQPLDETAQLAWRFLRARIEKPSLPAQRRVLPARLLLRDTTR